MNTTWKNARRRRPIIGDESEILAWTERQGAYVAVFDCRTNNTAAKFVRQGKRDHGFPSYCATNWNALNDVLHDWGWMQQHERLVVHFSGLDLDSNLGRSILEICHVRGRFYFRRHCVTFTISTARLT